MILGKPGDTEQAKALLDDLVLQSVLFMSSRYRDNEIDLDPIEDEFTSQKNVNESYHDDLTEYLLNQGVINACGEVVFVKSAVNEESWSPMLQDGQYRLQIFSEHRSKEESIIRRSCDLTISLQSGPQLYRGNAQVRYSITPNTQTHFRKDEFTVNADVISDRSVPIQLK